MRRRSDRLGGTPLASCLIELMDEERVGIRQLARIMGRSATVVADLRRGTDASSGRPIQPTPETIRGLARALATDWVKYDRDGRSVVDLVKKRRFFTALMSAAGYYDDQLVLALDAPAEVREFIASHPMIERVAHVRDATGRTSSDELMRALRAVVDDWERRGGRVEGVERVAALA